MNKKKEKHPVFTKKTCHSRESMCAAAFLNRKVLSVLNKVSLFSPA